MTSYLSINVRILVGNARKQLALLSGQLNSLSFKNATSGATGFGNAWNKLNLGRMGSQAQWLGRQIEYNFTLPLIAAGTAAMTMALNNEKAFTRVEKVYGDATHGAEFYKKELESLGRAFVALSNHFGVAQQDAINIAADWAAAGASGLALAKSVELTMRTMVLGELDAVKATKSLIAIQAQYGLTVKELSDAIDVLNMVENQTGASMADLIDGFTRSAGVARGASVSIEELAADIAALVPATGSAANAGNALKTIFSRLISPTNEVNEALKYMGIQIDGVGWAGSTAQQKLMIMAKSFEKLTDSEKGFVASTIATRYQVNRFEILMGELVNDHGYYARAIESSKDKTAVFNQAVRELNKVLESSPQRLKILWTQIQNASADIIQPLIPLILWLAQVVQRLMTAFSELNPSLQKFILFGLAALAAVGPIVRYFGALQVLVYELSKAFRILLIPMAMFRGMLSLISAIPIFRALVAISTGLRLVGTTALIAGAALPGFFTFVRASIAGMLPAIQFALFAIKYHFVLFFQGLMLIVSKSTAAIRSMWTTFLIVMNSITKYTMLTLHILWTAGFSGITSIIQKGIIAAYLVYSAGLVRFKAITAGFRAWWAVQWLIISTNPVLLLNKMWYAIIGMMTRILPTIRAASIAIGTALTGPWGIAIGIIIGLLVFFWDDIKAMWNNAVAWFQSNGKAIGAAFKPLSDAAQKVKNFVIAAFNKLPEGVRNALLAVVRVVHAAAMRVYELFSYFNPWARHSPSLVENVTTGVAAITSQYAKLGNVGAQFAAAVDDLDLFAEATRRVNRSAEANHYAEIRKDLVSLASDAVAPFDRLIKELYVLEDQLKVVGKAMAAQESIVDALKTNLDNANAALDTQVDVLRAMKDELDDYQQKINLLNGDLEVLTGTREALRQAGAGSDILSQYDDQIQAIKDQKDSIDDQMDAAQQAYDQQKTLIAQLTAARDQLQASYDLESAKLKALRDDYDQINDRIKAITGAISDFASAVEDAKKAAGSGGIGVTPADFPDVGGSGKLGREGGIGDQSAEIDKFTKEIADKTKNMFGLFDFLDPVKKAWGKVKEWLKANIAPGLAVIWDGAKATFGDLPNPFAKLDFSGFLETLKSMKDTVLDIFGSIWELLGPPLKEIVAIIKDKFGKAIKEIGPELAKFKELVGPLGELFKMAWENAKPLVMLLGGILLFVLKLVAEVIANTLGPVLDWIISIVKAVIRIFRGLIEFLTGLFTGDWELMWKGVKDIFGGIWDAIKSGFTAAVDFLLGIVKGLVDGVVGFFTWLWDELVGHSIVPDIVNGIIFWFNLMWKVVQMIWNALLTALKWAWENILLPIFKAFGTAIDGLKIIAARVFDWMKGGWNTFTGYIKAAHDKVIEFVAGMIVKFVNMISFLQGMKGKVGNAISGLWDGLVSTFKSALNTLISLWNRLDFSIDIKVPEWVPGVGGKGFSIKDIFPDIPMLASGGMVANQATAIVGEGRKGYPEYVIPTDPIYRKRALMLFEALGNQLGFNAMLGTGDVMKVLANQLSRGVMGKQITLMANGGMLGSSGTIRGSARSSTLTLAPSGDGGQLNFYGDLSFPNVKNGDDADEFIKNLRALTGS